MKKPWARWRWALGGWLARLRLWQPGKLMYIGGSDVLPAPLSREEESQLIQRLAQGDQSASGPLIEHNLRLVVYIARRFENTGINIEDLISIGTIGLIKAVGTYQPAKKIKLATYASRCIENEILMHLRKTAGQKSEVPFDEPLSTDWNGNELLLSDVLGTDSDLVVRPMEEDAGAGPGPGHPQRPGAGDHHPPLRPGRPPRAHPEGGGGPDGHLPVLHLPAGKADHWAAEEGDLEGDGGALRAGQGNRGRGRVFPLPLVCVH